MRRFRLEDEVEEGEADKEEANEEKENWSNFFRVCSFFFRKVINLQKSEKLKSSGYTACVLTRPY